MTCEVPAKMGPANRSDSAIVVFIGVECLGYGCLEPVDRQMPDSGTDMCTAARVGMGIGDIPIPAPRFPEGHTTQNTAADSSSVAPF